MTLPHEQDRPRLPKVALVTGAGRGLGLEVARHLARAGATAILATRDAARGERAARELRLDGLAAAAVAFDVRSDEQVREAARRVEHDHGRLDVLINNAGILPEAVAAPGTGPADAGLFEETYATNVFGPVRVTQAFLPLLRASAPARIVNVSSTMGSLADQGDPASPYFSVVVPAYQSSKAALNGVTVALAKALRDARIEVTSVCPGFARTDLTPVSRAQAPLDARDAARTVADVALAGHGTLSGRFVDRDGPVAW